MPLNPPRAGAASTTMYSRAVYAGYTAPLYTFSLEYLQNPARKPPEYLINSYNNLQRTGSYTGRVTEINLRYTEKHVYSPACTPEVYTAGCNAEAPPEMGKRCTARLYIFAPLLRQKRPKTAEM